MPSTAHSIHRTTDSRKPGGNGVGFSEDLARRAGNCHEDVGLGEAWQSLRNIKPTEAEEYADRALSANADYIRYRREARSLTASSVVRESRELRIDRNHKWGPQPFHFRRADYESIVESIRQQVKKNGGEAM
ncbi:DUF6270 domain-containing protein [Brevibacterium epidermidis]|uniref:DUF6270 domain-containing protein n=1 Tax=Brevibacterium epidermidis TaxID=1698 RepID=UPI0013000807|nr:DUF6270 domain-containing protein [Brevibacterium epidermidis]